MGKTLKRAYYQASIVDFIALDADAILGQLTASHPFAVDVQQSRAWQHQIHSLKGVLSAFSDSHVFFEF